MPFEIRHMRDGDADAVAALSLRAWAPVFDPGQAAARATYRKAGFTPVPGEHLFLLLDGDDG
jgi:hypothetical protein